MSDYNSQNIEVLKGLDPVRKRPGMYTDTKNPNHLVQEVVDNSVDEAINGYGNEIIVTLHADNSISVADKGRGMPVDMHKEEKKPALELIFTTLHAGGKFSGQNYNVSGGLHGVGVKVVNALSTKTEVTVKRGGKIYYMDFVNGETHTKLKTIGTCPKYETGTEVRFWPDAQYFDTEKYDLKSLRAIMQAKAILAPKVRMTFIDEQHKTKETWYYERGMEEFMTERLQSDFLPNPVYYRTETTGSETVELCLAWLFDSPVLVAESYANLIPTALGGTHVNGMRNGVLEAVREFATLHNLGDKKISLVADDIWGNCNYILSVKMPEPQFQGQTKEKLSSRSASKFTQQLVRDSFSVWLSSNVNLAKELVTIFVENARTRTNKETKVARKAITSGPKLPGKLTDCSSTDINRTELFIVEGNSAGGSARMARFKEFQAILPLKGKIKNT